LRQFLVGFLGSEVEQLLEIEGACLDAAPGFDRLA